MRIDSIIAMTSAGPGRLALLGLGLLILAGCGKSPPATTVGMPVAAPDAAAAPVPAPAPAGAVAAVASANQLAARSGELSNPDNTSMVYLYYDLAGIAPPIDQWVQNDSRVQYARGADKAAQRATVKATFDAGMAAVRGIGVLQLTTRANLSQYDPTYGEFTIGALSPGTVFTYQALGQKVTLKFDNGLTAQSWSVPRDQAQTIADKVGSDPLTLDMTLKIDKVLPQPDGGTIVSRVVSWNLRNARDGSTLARVQVANH